MTLPAFNPITYANKLKKAGMDVKLADVQAEEIVNIFNSSAASKEDVNKVQGEVEGLRKETKDEFKLVRSEMKVLELELKGHIGKMEMELKGFIVKGLSALGTVIVVVPPIIRHFLG